jgi:hypothetical protein
MGLKSNFESVAQRIGGVYGTPVTSGTLDGRMFAAATRYRRIAKAMHGVTPTQAVTLHAYAHHDLLGVMLAGKTSHQIHRESRSRRNLADWMQRLKKGKPRTWLQIRADATRELDRALAAFDLRWRRR